MIGLTYLSREVTTDRWTSIFVNVPSFRLPRNVIKDFFLYTILGNTLERVDDHEYHVVSISNDVRWEKHCNMIVKKANKILGLLRHILSPYSKVKSRAYQYSRNLITLKKLGNLTLLVLIVLSTSNVQLPVLFTRTIDAQHP